MTQRELAKRVGISLGKTNYWVTEMVNEGLIKFERFKNAGNKSAYTYVLTPKGIEEKFRLLIHFLSRKAQRIRHSAQGNRRSQSGDTEIQQGKSEGWRKRMTTVIATGCPHSDWEKVLPILQLSGLESAGDTFANWYDELFQPFSMMDPPQVEYQLQQEPKNGRSVAKLLPETSTAPLLLAESRSLWLLDFWAAKLPHAQFLLFYTRAESAVAHACVQGIDPHQFLEGWQVANRQLLRFQRCHRQQALLLDAEAAVRHPRELIEACRRFDLPLQTPPELPSSNPPVATVELLAGQISGCGATGSADPAN